MPRAPSSTTKKKDALAPAVRAWKQPRSAATRGALVLAARRVFEEKGFEAAQTPDIAAAAGVSTGAFYRYFKDKKEIFLEVLVLYLGAARDRVRARLAPSRFVGADARGSIALVIDVLFEIIRREAKIHRVFLSASMSDHDVAALRADYEAEERAELARLIAAVAPPGAVANPLAAAIVFQVAAVEVAVDRSGVRWRAGKRVSDGDVKRALGDMFHRYLFGGDVAPGGR